MEIAVREKPFIFIDFDGTITEKDTIISIMEKFAAEGWEPLKAQTLSRQISVKKGVGGMFSLVESNRLNEIVSYVTRTTKIREGFGEFIQFCSDHQIDYKVLSGGLDFYIYPLIGKLVPEEKILCNYGDFSKTNIQIMWKYPCDPYCHLDCGICKASLIRTYDPSRHSRILIGDSVTDFGAAAISDMVIGRDSLLVECQTMGIPVVPFTNFFDVVNIIKNAKQPF